MPLATVVIPVRNVAEHIGEVILDLRRQSFRDFEAIIVDDHSSDATVASAVGASDGDSRIKIVASPGRGASDARNAGLARAAGELIAFVDADDRLRISYLERLIDAIQSNSADLAICNVRRLRGYRTSASGLHLRAFRGLPHETLLKESPQLVYDSTIWNKLARRSLWEDHAIRFPSGRWINDVHPSLSLHANASVTATVRSHEYLWRARHEPGQSITDSKYADGAALRQSWEDRVFALEASRVTLTDVGAPTAVLARFDVRVLEHDFWTYLPLVTRGGESFARTVFSDISRYLEWSAGEVDLSQFGPLLSAVYGAVRGGDQERFEACLSPTVAVVSSQRRRHLDHRLVDRSEGAEIAVGRKRLWERRWSRVGPAIDVLVHGVSTIPIAASSGSVLIDGAARIRVGRSDAEGEWQIRASLRSEGSATSDPIATSSLQETPPTDVHPLLRSGWRPFSLRLPVDAIARLVGAESRHLVLEALLGGYSESAAYRLTGDAQRTLPSQIADTGDGDLIIAPDAPGGWLRFSKEATTHRVIAGTLSRGVLTIETGRTSEAGSDNHSLHLKASGKGGTRHEMRDLGHAYAIDLDDSSFPSEARFGIYASAVPDGSHVRLRTSSDFVEVGGPSPTDRRREWAVRTTARGRALIEHRWPRLLVESVGTVAESDSVIRLEGSFLHPDAEPVSVELSCDLDGSIVASRCIAKGGSWRADICLEGLLDGPDGPAVNGRRFTLIGIAMESRTVRTRLTHPPDQVAICETSTHHVEVLPGRDAEAMLDIRPVDSAR